MEKLSYKDIFRNYVVKDYETTAMPVGKPFMNIMFFSSQEQFKYIYVVAKSIIESNPQINIHFFVASFQKLDGKKEMNSFIEEAGNIITYYIVNRDIVNPLIKGKIGTRTGAGGLLRPLAHLFIEDKYDRVLFMDADMVVLGDIYSEFYNLDFEDNYLITTANDIDYEKQNTLKEEEFDNNRLVAGSYFNSALLLLNLKKLRMDITLEKIVEVYNSDIRIRNEQHLLNKLLATKTRYLDPWIYHCRWVYLYRNQNVSKSYIEKIRLFHFDPVYVPFKPWDIDFEDTSILEKIEDAKYKSIASPYRPYIINELTAEVFSWWWYYAKKTPIYNSLHERMVCVKEYFQTYIPTMINHYNKSMNDLENLRLNINSDEKKNISDIRKKQNTTWLNAVNMYYNLPICDYTYRGIDYEAVELNKYLEGIQKNEDLVIFLVGTITVHFVASRLKNKHCIGLNFNASVNDSYLAVIDNENNKIIEKTGKNLITQSYSIENLNKSILAFEVDGYEVDIQSKENVSILLKSEGYNEKTRNSYGCILINNIDYVQNVRGLNVVVYSRSKKMVVDSFCIVDGKLTIKR